MIVIIRKVLIMIYLIKDEVIKRNDNFVFYRLIVFSV